MAVTESIMLMLIGACLGIVPVAVALTVAVWRDRRSPAVPERVDPRALRQVAADLSRLSGEVAALAREQEKEPARASV